MSTQPQPENRPFIRIQMDLSPYNTPKILVIADRAEDRDKALGWLNQSLPQIELLEAVLKKLSEPEAEPVTTPVAGQ